MTIFISHHERSDMKSLPDDSTNMMYLMRMTPNIERSGRQSFRQSANKHGHTEKQHQSFGQIPPRSNLRTSPVPSQFADAMEDGQHCSKRQCAEDSASEGTHLVTAATGVEEHGGGGECCAGIEAPIDTLSDGITECCVVGS